MRGFKFPDRGDNRSRGRALEVVCDKYCGWKVSINGLDEGYRRLHRHMRWKHPLWTLNRKLRRKS